jgi:DNA (cytosine-5)-methyltransferase 1
VRVGSLFSGIGGLDLGLERAGMEIVWQVENNEFCQKVLKKHWPEVPCYGDIKEIDFTTLPPIDLICGGFPCQPVSSSGRKLAQQDERWLWPRFFECICQIKPRWVLLENVTGLLYRGMGDVLRDLSSIGYDAEWEIISAYTFGAKHQRQRVFIIAYPESFRLVQDDVFSGKFIESDFWKYRQFDPCLCPEKDWLVPYRIILRMANGFPKEMDRFKCLGNAVVPQVAQWIGERITRAKGER